ncbi:MAG: acyltransferase [Phenylobacterium sp.]|uniref:acyltransferase family protein n=1 Tax=Phenylobacterium sp. TaxID=1871053 RepID=UPI0025E06EA1|nr:acyltransferase [Phenylobacterium sp.]MBA4010446.1 acyltransferase [Phenylobacterium sp.]
MGASKLVTSDRAAESRGEAARPFRYPNFDWLRIAAATAVLFSHAFLLAQGTEENEPWRQLTGTILGIYGVGVFFVISGFLITRSAFNSRTLRSFAAARALRIYPALAACAALTSFVLGVSFTSMEPARFLADLIPLKHTIKTILHPGTPYDLVSVRFYPDALGMGRTFNGSLWTIPQELACYVIIGLLLVLRLLRWPVMVLLLLLLTLPAFGLLDIDAAPEPIGNFLLVAASFFAGSLVFFVWTQKQHLPAWPLLPCAAVLAVAIATNQGFGLFPLYGAYPLLMFATAQRWRLPDLNGFGDISYGMYLYGWPVQQTFVALAGGVGAISWNALFALSTLVAALLGYASWHLLEKRALRWKSLLLRRPVPQAVAELG